MLAILERIVKLPDEKLKSGHAMDLVDSYYTTLRAIERDESWLKEWICEDPSRLGLGKITVKRCELTHYKNKGGRLDILAYKADIDTYYEIELMLGECDASHGFRVLDYWAREKTTNPNSRHYAVLVAEDLSGRFKTLIDLLPTYLPFIGIEIRVLRLRGHESLATLQSVIVAQPDDLLIDAGDEPEDEGTSQPRDREWWEAKASPEFIKAVDALTKYTNEYIGPSRLDYSAQSYISLKKGRRCWLPMWPRSGGVYIYLPGGSGGTNDEPSEFYIRARELLIEAGFEEPTWTCKYNAGANPIAFAIPLEKVDHSTLHKVLTEGYEVA